MKQIELTDGSKILIGIEHLPNKYKPQPLPQRITKVCLVAPDKSLTLAEAEASCSSMDNFCRRTGRKIAANRLLTKLRRSQFACDLWSKENRRRVFAAVCPEFFGPNPTT